MRVQSLPLQPLSLLLAALAPSLLPSQSPIYKVDTSVLPEKFNAVIQATGDIDKDGRADFSVTGLGVGDTLTLMSGGKGIVLQAEKGGRDRAVILVDLDGDGILEYVSSSAFYSAGTVIVRSKTSTGTVKYRLTPPTGSRSFGVNVTVIGDINKDGVRDLAISGPSDIVKIGSRMIVGVGQVFFYSGKDGKSLGLCAPTELVQEFGADVTGLSDVDGDGVTDVAIASRRRTFIYSGAKKTLIRELGSRAYMATLGAEIANVGDMDGDRVSDVAVMRYFMEGRLYNRGVTVFSSKKGYALFRVSGAPNDVFGHSISGGADLNGDNIPDFVVGAPQRSWYWKNNTLGNGYLRAFSGKDGKEIFTVTGTKASEGFGAQVEIIGDVNGDGVADIATVRQNLNGAPFTTPFTQVISGRRLMLTTNINRIVASRGGRQTFSIDAGASHAGDLYLVLGSLYTQQGFTVNQVRIPLALDTWFLHSLSLANTAMFSNTIGFLDAKGRAQASLNLPKFQRHGFEGLNLQHSAVILRNGVVQAASAAAYLRVSN